MLGRIGKRRDGTRAHRTARQRVFTLSLALLLQALLWAGGGLRGQTVRTQSPRDTMEVGDTVSLSVTVRAAPGADVLYSMIPDTLAGGLELFAPPAVDTLERSDTAFITRLRVVVSAYDSGWRVIPGIPVLVRHRGVVDTLLSEPSLLYVALSPRDTALRGELRPIRGPIAQGITFAELWPWLLLLIALAGLGGGVYYFLQWRKRQRGATGLTDTIPVDPRSAQEIALEELRALLQTECWRNGQEKLFFTRLSDSLRAFLHRYWGLRTLEETTRSITRQLQREERCAPNHRQQCQSLLELSDLVKFSRFSPDEATCEESVKQAIALVNAMATRTDIDSPPSKAEASGTIAGSATSTSTHTEAEGLRYTPQSTDDLTRSYRPFSPGGDSAPREEKEDSI